MGSAKPLKQVGQFFEGMVRDTVGSLTGIAQAERGFRERAAASRKKTRTAIYERFDPADIEAFAQMGSELTGKTKAELEAAKPKAFTEKTRVAPDSVDATQAMQRRKELEASWAERTGEERSRIQGLYKTGQARLGAIEQGRLRPGARKQTVLTKRKY